jgi:endonuclease/exonuclease/phosphatase family metal-dependent hydrolase
MKLLSLNLHGHHPMGEPDRWLEDRSGRIRRADTNLHHFTTEELDRGSRRRLDHLAADLGRLAPDVLCLQEVAAGCPWTARDNEIFHRAFDQDWFEANSALRLARRLNADLPAAERYQVVLACRGNVGWITWPGIFDRERIVIFNDTRQKTIHDFHDNPYPGGILVEGFAVLVRPPWRVLEHQADNLPFGSRGERFFVQRLALQKGDGPTVVLANLHLGHKIRHFEQALAVRLVLAELAHRHLREGEPANVVVAGDFNATLYRPNNTFDHRTARHRDIGTAGRPIGPLDGAGEPSMIPWELHVEGQFDYRPGHGSKGELLETLWRLNEDHYKPSATLREPGEANLRIRSAADLLFDFQQAGDSPMTDRWRDALEQAGRHGRTGLPVDLPRAGDLPGRIDHILIDRRCTVERACLVYPDNGWASTAGTSDHPAVYAELSFPSCGTSRGLP